MMRKLDQRGVSAFEFCAVAVAFFTFVYAVFDLGRYAITMQSLRALASAGARAMMICCYTPSQIGLSTAPLPPCPTSITVVPTSRSSCTGSYLTTGEMKTAAPFLYAGGLTPTLAIAAGTSGASPLTVTASQPNFTMLLPIWGTALNAPSASTQVPF
jgi:Flp pilus assembly protein TadG